jgi:predicted transcriptional regulator
MRYTNEYKPAISETCKTYIYNNIKSVYQNEEGCIYSLHYVYEELSDLIAQNDGEAILGITPLDIEVLNKLINENVDYIEF